ncbi:hypothetical protein H310_02870 [Aphanomyces invadans]|uniref:Uncharacterized protein n=1 Tax=Aphanomyces invadans TaxID=157072 RepID=A0A024UM32_9STRA|nr:hypothetical protein H310_02870 [Aphanomyces invadans]ETW06688.1 hypothetical protein H310_02870 [Aphanomyces invadans]|eukprot:XP_008864763.1 hypothetical protein H310_02870 [Aphanomyces invadans]
MSVPWPRNRFSYDVISPEAHAFVDKIFASRSDQPLMMKWVNQHKNKATFSKRILVLSNYRLMTLKPPGLGTKLKVSKDLSFLDLLKIQVEQCDSSTTMKAIFTGGRILHVDPGMHCEEVVRMIQRRIHQLADAFPLTSRPKFGLPAALHWDEYSIDMSDKDKVVEAFRACCDYHLVPFRDDIAAKLKTAMDSSPCIVDFELCILGMVRQRHLALELILERSVVVQGFHVGDEGVAMAFQALEQPHSVVSTLRLSKVRMSHAGLQALESVAKAKEHMPTAWSLTALDLSENSKWTKESVTALVSAMKSFPSPLQAVNLAQCSLPEIAQIVTVLDQPSWTAALQTLNLSFNPIDYDATTALTGWLSRAKALHHLNLAGTGIDTFQLINALKRNVSLHRSSFVALDLSYNMLKATTAAALGEMLGTTHTLAVLVLRNMKPAIAATTLSTIMAPWFQNPHFVVSQPNHESTPPPLLTLDLSENNLSDGGAHVLADLIAHSPRVRRDVLKLNQCALHDDSVEAIVTALAQCDALSSLHLEDNDGRPRPKSIFAPAARLRLAPGDAFVKLLTKQRHLKAVYLSNSTCAAMQYSIAVLRGVVHSLGTGTSSVEIVDISGNRGGDDVAKCIAAVLPKTQRLRALFWDGNHTTLAGFRLVQDALRHNRSLCVMPVPLQDTRRLLERRDPQREALFAVLGSMCETIERNQAFASEKADLGSVASSVIFREDGYDKMDGMRRSWLQGSPPDLRQSWSRGIDDLTMVTPTGNNSTTTTTPNTQSTHES